MASSYLFLLPIIVYLWFNLTFLLTFILAVVLGHIYPVFPFIRATDTFVPERCIFGQLINMGSILWVVYVRWRQIGLLCTEHELNKKTRLLNLVSVYLGWLNCLATSMVANFQTTVMAVHVASSALACGSGVLWVLLQTVQSYWLRSLTAGVTWWLLALRVTLAALSTIAFVVGGVLGILLKSSDGFKMGHWNMHLSAAIFEWFMMFLSMTYILTLSKEFGHVYLSAPVVRVHTPLLLQEAA